MGLNLSLYSEEQFTQEVSRKKMGFFLRALRKSRQMTQEEFAEIFKVAQGSVSKFEEGSMEISAINMINLCKELNISVESFCKFYLDSKKTAHSIWRKENNKFKIPEKYKDNCSYNIRGISPLINFVRNHFSEQRLNEILDDMQIDPSFLYLMDGQVNANFLEDFNQLAQIDAKEFDSFFKSYFKSTINHGECHLEYSMVKNKLEVIKRFISNSGLYDFAIDRKIIKETDVSLEINYRLKQNDALESIIDGYHAKFLELMATYCDNFDENLKITRKWAGEDLITFEVLSVK